MNDYPIAANAETIRLITFSGSNRGFSVGVLLEAERPDTHELARRVLARPCDGLCEWRIEGRSVVTNNDGGSRGPWALHAGLSPARRR